MYFVVHPSGEKFGPADEATLQQWIQEGRLTPTTVLEDSATRMQFPASSLPGLQFNSAAAPPQSPPSYGQPGPGPQGYGQPHGGFNPMGNHYNRGETYGSGPLPEQYKKFNWGAFVFTWIWGLNHKKPILLVLILLGLIGRGNTALGAVIGVAQLGISIYLGIVGNQWAWDSGRFSTPDEMQKCQTIWGWWALGFFLLCAVGVFLAVLLPLMARGLN
ncbi:MAG: hypothetical protein JNJ45_06735 [Chthonomonas sp.]|nr:hypothetical protein [Chthonomonas sp.]